MDIIGERLREAASFGDEEALLLTISRDKADVNSRNCVNGWTALHWACKRENEKIVKLLLNFGADPNIVSNSNEKPADLCSNPKILDLLGGKPNMKNSNSKEMLFLPNYLSNPPITSQVEMKPRKKHTDFSNMPTTALPTSQEEYLIFKIRISGISDTDFIEIEVPKSNLNYKNLIKICCEELECLENQVERLRKLPDTRLRKDSDVKRLQNYQALELVLKGDEKSNNCYQSISTCKDQTILY